MKKFSLEIITPEKVVLKDEIEFLVVPAYEGEIGILPGHAPLLAQLMPGELRITKDAEKKLFAISGGFVEIHPDNVRVFVETAEMAEDIDLEKTRLSLERAKDELKRARGSELDIAKAQVTLNRAMARLRVAESLKRRVSKRN